MSARPRLTGVVGEGEQGIESAPPHERAFELAQLLLEHGAHPNDGQALYNTQFTENDCWLELLLAHGLRQGDLVNWSSEGLTTLDYQLCQAVHWSFPRRVSLLLSHGADPNAKSVQPAPRIRSGQATGEKGHRPVAR